MRFIRIGSECLVSYYPCSDSMWNTLFAHIGRRKGAGERERHRDRKANVTHSKPCHVTWCVRAAMNTFENIPVKFAMKLSVIHAIGIVHGMIKSQQWNPEDYSETIASRPKNVCTTVFPVEIFCYCSLHFDWFQFFVSYDVLTTFV